MKRYFRKWGMCAITLLVIASTLAPTASLAWTPTGEKPIDNGDQPGDQPMDAIGDPTDGGHGAPQRVPSELLMVSRLMLMQYLNANVDSRVVNWRVFFRDLTVHQRGRSSR